MKKIVLALLTIALIFAGSTAFASGQTEDDGTMEFVMVPKGVHPYYEPCYEGFKDAGAKYGIEVDYVAPAKFDISLQVKVIEDLIAQDVDGIAISALDDAGLIAVIKEAMEAGIKVITFDAAAPSTSALSYVGTVNEDAGYAAGEEMVKRLNKGDNIVILQGGLGATNLNQRTAGFKKALEGSGINILEVNDTKGNISDTVNNVEALMQTYSDIDAFFGISALCAPGAATVVKQQGKTDDILIAGFDDLEDTLLAIKEGTVDFCLVQKTYNMGWLSIETLLAANNGESVEQVQNTGVLVVNKDNADTYMAEMKNFFN